MKANYLSESLFEKAQANFSDKKYSTALEFLKKALDHIEDHRSPLKGHLFLLMAKTYYAMIQYRDARKVSTQALEYLLVYDHLYEAAQIYELLGHVALQMGQYQEAIRQYHHALYIIPLNSPILPEQQLKAKIHLSLGFLAQNLLDLENQQKHFCRSLCIAKRIGDEDLLAQSLLGLGMYFFQKQNFDQGRKILLKSFKFFNQLGDVKGIAQSLHVLGQIYSKAEEFHRAINALKLAYYLFEHLDDPIQQASILVNLARIYLPTEIDRVRELCGQATDLLSSQTSVHSKRQSEIILAQSYVVMGLYYNYTQNYEMARYYLKESIELFQTYQCDHEYQEALDLFNNVTVVESKRKPKKNNILAFKLGMPG